MDDRKETQLVTNSDCYRAGKTIRPTGIMVHSTGVAHIRLLEMYTFFPSWLSRIAGFRNEDKNG